MVLSWIEIVLALKFYIYILSNNDYGNDNNDVNDSNNDGVDGSNNANDQQKQIHSQDLPKRPQNSEQQLAVHNVNGHSNSTAKQHYMVKRNSSAEQGRLQDVVNTETVMTHSSGFQPSATLSSTPVPVSIDIDSVSSISIIVIIWLA